MQVLARKVSELRGLGESTRRVCIHCVYSFTSDLLIKRFEHVIKISLDQPNVTNLSLDTTLELLSNRMIFLIFAVKSKYSNYSHCSSSIGKSVSPSFQRSILSNNSNRRNSSFAISTHPVVPRPNDPPNMQPTVQNRSHVNRDI